MSGAASVSERRWLIEAVAWRSRLTETGAESSEAFEAWLAADPGCARAWQQVQRSWEYFDRQAATPELLELRRAALRNVRDAGRERERGAAPARWRRTAMAAAVLMVVATGLLTWRLNSPDIYRTETGEIRVVTLKDGSRVALDSRSEIRVTYSEHARELQLSRGQARFDVAHDIERPFSVTVNRQKVIATGTAFNIDMLSSRVLITLISGSVAVLPTRSAATDGATQLDGNAKTGGVSGDAAPAAINMRAGEQLVVTASAPPYLTNVSIDRTTAWQAGRLVFDNEPLASVVERVSRYADQPLHVGDAAVGSMRISGVFRAGDIDGFVETITNYVAVRAERGKHGEILLRQRG